MLYIYQVVTYADAYCRMLTYADVSCRMLTYADVYQVVTLRSLKPGTKLADDVC